MTFKSWTITSLYYLWTIAENTIFSATPATSALHCDNDTALFWRVN